MTESVPATQSIWIPLLPVLAGGAIGIAGSVVTAFSTDFLKRRADRVQLIAALTGEIAALVEITKRRKYIEGLAFHLAEMQKLDKMPAETPFYTFSIRRNPFAVYDANLERIGIIKIPLARQIVKFYAQASALTEDIKDMGEKTYQRTLSDYIQCLAKTHRLFVDTIALGENIIAESAA